MRSILLIGVILLPGCALMPDSIPVEVSHVSHLTQHFGKDPTNLGYNTLYAGLKWKRGNFSIKVEEGYTPEHMDNMHEMFQGSIEYDIPLHK